jgi:hypothetical protein
MVFENSLDAIPTLTLYSATFDEVMEAKPTSNSKVIEEHFDFLAYI